MYELPGIGMKSLTLYFYDLFNFKFILLKKIESVIIHYARIIIIKNLTVICVL